MTNLGTDKKLNTATLTSKIMLAIANGVAKQGTGILPKEIVNTMKSTLGGAIKLGETAVKDGEKLLEDAGKEVLEGFKGLLKPKKEE